MNKKGSEHVDWIVSMGIFLVALITIFLLLKPGIQKEGNESFLLDLLEEKFTNDFFLNVKKVPLIIGVCEAYTDESRTPSEIRPRIDIDSGSGWSLTQTQLVAKDGNGEVIDFGVNKDPIWNGITCVSSNEAPSGGGCSNYNCHITDASTNSDFVYYFTYYQSDLGSEFSIVDSSTSDCILDYCNYRIGAIDNLYGLDVNGLSFRFFQNEENRGEGLNYGIDKIKETWSFPDNKDFFIKADNNGILKFNYETKKPEERANIYVKIFRTNWINKYGEVTPVVIYFGVW